MLRIPWTALVAAAICVLTIPGLADAARVPKPARMPVTMTDRVCKVEARSALPGPTTFRISNRGSRPRTFAIAGRRSPFVKRRKTAALTVKLVRGRTYRYTCTARRRPRSVKRGTLRVGTASQSPQPGVPRPQPPPSECLRASP